MEAASQALALGVRPVAVAAALERWPGRRAVVASLLGLDRGTLDARVRELVRSGMTVDAALDWLVLSS